MLPSRRSCGPVRRSSRWPASQSGRAGRARATISSTRSPTTYTPVTPPCTSQRPRTRCGSRCELIEAGAIVGSANRRGAQPLHYAVDGMPGSARWNPVAQGETVRCLVELGADPNVVDKNGTTPLHRAVRNRCAAAVAALLDAGADPHVTNGRGSTAIRLAHLTTGRGGSGSTYAKTQQQEILGLLNASGARA
jgi:hypothetical protein